MSLRVGALALALLTAAVLPAAGGGGPAVQGKTLRFDMYSDVQFIDPAHDP